ncbi:MAG TPA: hypothetical protein PKC31_00785 [Candidatus Nanoperiomorbaceae bacterium]|nr:hypothetical protein [Candidatus Nanoperiomorbaceae bacterium]HMQ96699.1 hypothetical protein [Candidatus Nanoperiomorbaceae bacterium]HMR85983.1 hypothetical protein [Candidatus Nanoperiomorbaceae bacterium]HMU11971.1 hypothetical protein [Candidatus Nanoperiomorbaceae bacterium]
MSPRQKLTMIKTVHTIIYLIMVWAVFYLLYAAINQTYSVWFYLALGLLVIESLVFALSGMKCPLTALAKKYGDNKGYVGDLFIPERFSKYTFRVFGTIFLVSIVLLLLNVLNIR